MDESDAENRVRGLLDEARIHLEDAVDVLRQVVRISRDHGGPDWLHGQLEAYTIPWLQTFGGDGERHQPGSLGSLERGLEEEDRKGVDAS
jgi:hypothetical protein